MLKKTNCNTYWKKRYAYKDHVGTTYTLLDNFKSIDDNMHNSFCRW